ncbi:vanadium-dependent haloperoxidase [Runella slithyformis]|uniref:Phosphoesterase PA-phosphatase related protein n=1 Tax=Runella slithyformis (strain ATCC 29530 / DSM 19594 / LMG 11500 / NCIMB 11436 / LSU 4) TaxID=761193 RepID=A0A7U3ZQV4_RUNSL|nr:vanadium-dependent haloperoxidase [Runella slithyformis]AEI51687.1 phosphoesterase PA-phosphatase related protein [Runella slithyformis DSM 19594]
MRKSFLAGATTIVFLMSACKPKSNPEEYNAKAADPELYHKSVELLTEVIIHDIFKPPVASRIYVYANLAGYEAMVPGYPNYQSLGGKLKGFTAPAAPEAGKEYCFPLASTRAFLKVARTLTFSASFFDDYEKEFYKKYEAMGVPEEVMENSMAYGDSIAAHVMRYSAKDSYKQTRGIRFTVTNKPGTWVPTPPAYADACEPQWNKIRLFTLDTVTQFMPPRPPMWSTDKNSEFWRETREVYEISNKLTEEQKRIAWFWDDNPFVMNVVGHVMFANKKMTPGGHWLAIHETVSRKTNASFEKSVEGYALSSIALLDAFVACWDEKYRSTKVRPETVINSDIDPKWQPFLQTPPFPEYTSGHSTISAAAAEVLSFVHGDNVAFTDSTEFKHGHGVMSFTSFREAALMASISRVYGGIHYRSGCDEGNKCGVKIGKHVLKVAQTRKQSNAVTQVQ